MAVTGTYTCSQISVITFVYVFSYLYFVVVEYTSEERYEYQSSGDLTRAINKATNCGAENIFARFSIFPKWFCNCLKGSRAAFNLLYDLVLIDSDGLIAVPVRPLLERAELCKSIHTPAASNSGSCLLSQSKPGRKLNIL